MIRHGEQSRCGLSLASRGASMRRQRILLVSSQEFGWGDLRMALGALEEACVVGDATCLGKAMELVTACRPEVIIAAARLDGVPTMPLLTELHSRLLPASKIIVIASRPDPVEFAALDGRHIAAYLIWSDLCRETLLHCLGAVIRSDIVVRSRTVATMGCDSHQHKGCPHTDSVQLTERERAVLRRLAEGLTQEQIARLEHLSLRTVERVVATLAAKLDAPSQFVLGLKAARFCLTR